MKNQSFQLIATSVFGLEAIVKQECLDLGFENVRAENGRVYFQGGFRELALANLWLRTAERVLIELASFKATSFEELFQGIKDIDWPSIIPKEGKMIVNAKTVSSKLMSVSDIQSIGKRAIIKAMSEHYGLERFPEDKEAYRIEIAFSKDVASVTLDTSGVGLHKRGYRKRQTAAPMKETLAAALVQLSNWEASRPLVDLFCGSGTILIEAAMIAKNIAPGIQRDFDFVHWQGFDQAVFRQVKSEAYEEMLDEPLDIIGFDIDPEAVKIARENAVNAGVEEIQFVHKDVKDVGLLNNFGVLISNPPYGERLGDDESLKVIYQSLKALIEKLTTWSFYIITSDKELEQALNKRSDQKRKLFNGRIQVDYYQFIGPDPNLLI